MTEGHPKHWIAGAISHPGALTRSAHKAGESPMTFARSHMHAPGVTGKRARLAMTLHGFQKKRSSIRESVMRHHARLAGQHEDGRTKRYGGGGPR